MNSKEMVCAAIEGKKLEHYPVHSAYTFLSNADHWEELTGRSVADFHRWCISDMTEHEKVYKIQLEKLPYDTFQPYQLPSYEERENTSVIEKDEGIFLYNKKDDVYTKMSKIIHGSNPFDRPVEIQTIFDKKDVDNIKIKTADFQINNGSLDAIKAAQNVAGREKFLISGGIVNTFYSCSWHLGFQNLFPMLYEEPELVHYLSEKILEQNVENARALAKMGGDAIYIDDAASTNDMISLKHYEEFSLPYLTRLVAEVKKLGMISIFIYFGGIQDRVEQIASAGAEVLLMEATMKNYVNDYEYVANKLNGKMCLMGNLNPYTDMEITSDDEFNNIVKKQVDAGRKYGRFINCTGSPITPHTSVDRIRNFIDLSHTL